MRCPLSATRTQVVFGSGDPNAELMFVGEAPGFHEDQQGVPFVGQAGQLLEKLLNGIGLSRTDVYIANVLKCRPPGNRDPQPEEIEACESHLFRQIELIKPTLVATLGNFATKLLSGKPAGITRVHGVPQQVALGGNDGDAVSRSTTRPRPCTRGRCSPCSKRTSRGSPSCSAARPPPRRHRSRPSRSLCSSARPSRQFSSASSSREVELQSSSPGETEELAARLARELVVGDVVAVSGELGSGKTTFVRGACRALGVTAPVTSPTYTIGHRYEGDPDVSHLDLYRFTGVSAAEWGDLEPYFDDAIVFVEWPEAAAERAAAGARVGPPRARRRAEPANRDRAAT